MSKPINVNVYVVFLELWMESWMDCYNFGWNCSQTISICQAITGRALEILTSVTIPATVRTAACAGRWWRRGPGVCADPATLARGAASPSPAARRSPADTGATALSSDPGRASGASAATRATAASSVTSRTTAAPGKHATVTGRPV